MRLIDADAVKDVIAELNENGYDISPSDFALVRNILLRMPTIDAVPVGAYEQTRWERDMAISQLAEIGKSLCEKMDNVATVVRCKDCKYWGMHKSLNVPWCFEMHIDKSEEGYCDIGERREDG